LILHLWIPDLLNSRLNGLRNLAHSTPLLLHFVERDTNDMVSDAPIIQIGFSYRQDKRYLSEAEKYAPRRGGFKQEPTDNTSVAAMPRPVRTACNRPQGSISVREVHPAASVVCCKALAQDAHALRRKQ
jgi:hypothetical protein